MKDLLEEKCGLFADKEVVRAICERYRIPFDIEGGNCCRLWIISRKGVCFGGIPWFMRATHGDTPVFQSAHSLDMYLFNYLLTTGSQTAVHKSDYKTYSKTITLLKKLGINATRDRAYFKKAKAFYIYNGQFKEVDELGTKVISSFREGVQFKAEEFLEKLIEFANDNYDYISHILHYPEVGDDND